jgi:aryl-alcohol dehydrogenase-like predicted oxidoreductase
MNKKLRERFSAAISTRAATSRTTADGYTNSQSEELVGKFIKDAKIREQVDLATKFSFNAQPGNPNAGGNGPKNIYRAIEGSL